MASKLAAAKIAAWSGVETVIADAGRPGVLRGGGGRRPGRGHRLPAPARGGCPARKLWIAFAVGVGRARSWSTRAPAGRWSSGDASLLPAGVVSVSGRFDADDAVEIAGPDGVVFAKGLVRHPAELDRVVGRSAHGRAARRRRARGRPSRRPRRAGLTATGPDAPRGGDGPRDRGRG